MAVIPFEIDDELKKDFQKLCIDNGVSMSESIRGFIRSEVEKHGNGNQEVK